MLIVGMKHNNRRIEPLPNHPIYSTTSIYGVPDEFYEVGDSVQSILFADGDGALENESQSGTVVECDDASEHKYCATVSVPRSCSYAIVDAGYERVGGELTPFLDSEVESSLYWRKTVLRTNSIVCLSTEISQS